MFFSINYLQIFRKKLDEKYTVGEIIDTLKEMNLNLKDDDYIPSYIRTDLTDDLHDKFGFRTDFEIITEKKLKKFVNKPKIKKVLNFIKFKIRLNPYK